MLSKLLCMLGWHGWVFLESQGTVNHYNCRSCSEKLQRDTRNIKIEF